MQFAYTAKTSTGELCSGVITARALDEAKRELRAQQMFPIDVHKNLAASSLMFSRQKRKARGVSQRDLLSMTTQLAVMTRSGIDLASALNSLAKQSRNTTLKKVLTDVHVDVTGGKSVSDSMRAQDHVFGDAYVASLAAGEAAGRLPDVLNRLSQLIRGEIRIRNTVRTLLAYPILLASISSLVVAGLLIFVLPQFKNILGQFDVELPQLTKLLLTFSSFLQNYMWLWVPAAVAGVLGVILSRLTKGGRRWWDGVLLNLTGIREITRAFYIGRTFRLLGLMIDSGVPLLEGLQLTRNSIKNTLYRDLFDQLEDDILNGRGLADSMVAAGFIPPVAAEMVLTAEKTGTLGMVTQLMGEHYEEEGEAKLREVATMVEPLIIVVMGAIVAMVVMAVMFPMFEIATIAQ